MVEDAFYHNLFVNQAYDFDLMVAMGMPLSLGTCTSLQQTEDMVWKYGFAPTNHD